MKTLETMKKNLKKTKTKVTTRDGNVIIESKDSSGSFVGTEGDENEESVGFVINNNNIGEDEEFNHDDDDDRESIEEMSYCDTESISNSQSEIMQKVKWMKIRDQKGDGFSFNCVPDSNNVGDQNKSIRIGCFFPGDLVPKHESHFDSWCFLLHSIGFFSKNRNSIKVFTAKDCSNYGFFKNFDCLIFPGGSIFDFERAFVDRPDAWKNLIKWMKDGGGYIGVCAGAFLASRDGYSGAPLKGKVKVLAPAKETSWVPGAGSATIRFTDLASQVLGPNCHDGDLQKMYFANGAIFSAEMDRHRNQFKIASLAEYVQVITNKSKDTNRIQLYPDAILCGHVGKGKFVVYGPHPEASGLFWKSVIKHSILWTCGR